MLLLGNEFAVHRYVCIEECTYKSLCRLTHKSLFFGSEQAKDVKARAEMRDEWQKHFAKSDDKN